MNQTEEGSYMKLQMQKHSTEGLLITFCGLDGCGKTTLISMLREYLEEMSLPVMLTKQPTDEVRRNRMFRTYMDFENHDEYEYRALSLLAASDRVQHSNKVILPALQEGQIVISDRYFYSCLANLQARGYTEDKWIYEISCSIPQPDIAFFLDVDVDTAVKRVRQRPTEKDSYIDIGLQHKLKKNYINIARENNGVILNSKSIAHDTFVSMKKHLNEIMQSDKREVKGS